MQDEQTQDEGLDARERPLGAQRFAQLGHDIILRDTVIAQARSKTMAARIAAALNRYIPSERGR